jgi:CRP/FNR family cyclic AMP-dependent transcriptional regulator
METLERIVSEHPFFQGLAPHHLQFIAGCASNLRFDAGRLIFREGEDADSFYLIRQGKIALEVFHLEHGPITIETLGEGEVVGWSWLVQPYRWRFDGRAVELTRAIALDGKCLRAKCEASPDLGYELMKRIAQVLAQRLQATRLQLLDVYSIRR